MSDQNQFRVVQDSNPVHTSSNYSSTLTSDSRIEEALLRSSEPINVNETEEATALGHRGILLNRNEILNWRGPVPITQYRLNDDQNPEVINKTINQPVEYTQEVQVKYLRPPTPPPPGELIIRQESTATQLPAAPALIIRQQSARPPTPEPLVIRENPPEPPVQIQRKVVTIKTNTATDAPPRKVIIEKMAPLPAKPQPVIVERWLPYKEQKRRVIFQSAQGAAIQEKKVRNTIIQWASSAPIVKKSIKYLGVVNADPREYVQRYGPTLKKANELPSFVVELENNNGYQKYVSDQGKPYQLEGDLEALKYIDLDREGLSMYRHYVSGNTGSSISVGPVGVTTSETHLYSNQPYFNQDHQNITRY